MRYLWGPPGFPQPNVAPNLHAAPTQPVIRSNYSFFPHLPIPGSIVSACPTWPCLFLPTSVGNHIYACEQKSLNVSYCTAANPFSTHSGTAASWLMTLLFGQDTRADRVTRHSIIVARRCTWMSASPGAASWKRILDRARGLHEQLTQ